MKATKIDANSCKLTLGTQEIAMIMACMREVVATLYTPGDELSIGSSTSSKVIKLLDELVALMNRENIPFL